MVNTGAITRTPESNRDTIGTWRAGGELAEGWKESRDRKPVRFQILWFQILLDSHGGSMRQISLGLRTFTISYLSLCECGSITLNTKDLNSTASLYVRRLSLSKASQPAPSRVELVT
jgi:hypothetical protein